jgi:hypothetical protein
MAETLDALLKEFDTGTASPPPAQPPQPSALELDQIERHARDAAVAEEQHQRNLQAQNPSPEQALQAAVRMFRSGDLADADEVAAEGYILARSRHDAQFNADVSSGDARRAAKAIEIARKDYQAVTGHGYIESDRERARASVRGNAAQSESASEFDARRAGRMSDQEWAADVAKRNGLNVRPPNVWTGDLRSVAASPWALHDSGRGGGGPPTPGSAGSKAKPMIGRR